MYCFDSTFVIDYLSADERTVEFLSAAEPAEFYVPAVVVYEAYAGEVFTENPVELTTIREYLNWAKVVPVTERTCREAATVQRELLEYGTPLSARDAMVAGAARETGATLVTEDADFLADAVREVVDVQAY